MIWLFDLQKICLCVNLSNYMFVCLTKDFTVCLSNDLSLCLTVDFLVFLPKNLLSNHQSLFLYLPPS